MHGRFQTYGFDLGQYDNIFWTTLHGQPLRDTPLGLDKNWARAAQPRGAGGVLLPAVLRDPAGRLDPAGHAVVRDRAGRDSAVPLRVPPAAARVRGRSSRSRTSSIRPCTGCSSTTSTSSRSRSLFVLLVIDFVDDRRYCAVRDRVRRSRSACREDISVGLAILGAFLALSGHRVRAGWSSRCWRPSTSCHALHHHAQLRGWGFQDIYKELFPTGRPQLRRRHRNADQQPDLHVRVAADRREAALHAADPAAAGVPARAPQLPGRVDRAGVDLHAADHRSTRRRSTSASSTPAHFIPYVFAAAALAIAAYRRRGEGTSGGGRRCSRWSPATVICGVFWGAIPPRDTVHGGFHMLTMTRAHRGRASEGQGLSSCTTMIPPDGVGRRSSEAEMPHVSRMR